MAAHIRSLFDPAGGVAFGTPLDNVSRDDLRRGYSVQLHSIDVAAVSYNWAIAFTPDSSGPADTVVADFTGTSSVAVLAPDAVSQTVTFTIDNDGAYLIRLVIDAGEPTEDTQFVRLRSLTKFANLKLPAAGERRDATGIVPIDADVTGWTDDLNQNFLRLSAFIRRAATSGRVMYVDANRGRDVTKTVNDPTNVIHFPGTDSSLKNETGIRAKAEGFADFSSIMDAIGYVQTTLPGYTPHPEPAPSATNPYVIIVKPGFYNEFVTFAPYIYVVAETTLDNPSYGGVVIRATAGHHHTYVGTSGTDYTVLVGLNLENDGSVDDPVLVHDGGLLTMSKCTVTQRRVAAANDAALIVDSTHFATDATLYGCDVTSLALPAGPSYVISTLGTNANTLVLDHCTIQGSMVLNSNVNDAPLHVLYLLYSMLLASTNSYVVKGNPTILVSRGSTLEKATAATEAIFLGPYGAWANNVTVNLQDTSVFGGDISFDPTAAITGNSSFITSNVQLHDGDIVFPAPAPTYVTSDTLGKSIQYAPAWVKPETGAAAVPAAIRLTASLSVQDAIDCLINALFVAAGAPFISLDRAYDGLSSLNPPTPATGAGRVIVADAGSVKITGATPPVSATDPDLKGSVQVEGRGEFGPVTDVYGTEISLQPVFGAVTGAANGCGPFISMGRSPVPLNGDAATHRGLPAAIIQAGNAKGMMEGGDLGPYNMFLRTRNRVEAFAGEAGRVVLEGGTVPHENHAVKGGSVYVQGGSNYNTAVGTTPGNVYLTPGYSSTGVPHAGSVYLVKSEDAGMTKASLLAAGAYGAPTTEAGDIWIATPHGVEKFSIANGDNLATTIANINANSLALLASNPGGAGKLLIECLMPGPNGDVIFLGDSNSGILNVCLGNLTQAGGAVLTPGTYGAMTDLSVVASTALIDTGSGGICYIQLTSATLAGEKVTIEGEDYVVGIQANAGAAAIALVGLILADPTRTVNAYTTAIGGEAQATVSFVGIVAGTFLVLSSTLTGATLSGNSKYQIAAELKHSHSGRFVVTAGDVTALALPAFPPIVIGSFNSAVTPETILVTCRTATDEVRSLASVRYWTVTVGAPGVASALLIRDVGAVLETGDVLDFMIIG
jgi:hypothetical protein